jgi:uncharacterized protein
MDQNLKYILAELRLEYERIYGERLVTMVLYGSQARGDAEPGADIDVLVVLKGPVQPGEEIARTSAAVSSLCLKHEVVIAEVFMDETTFLTRQGPLLRNVRREGINI